jgi:hypothetical protein
MNRSVGPIAGMVCLSCLGLILISCYPGGLFAVLFSSAFFLPAILLVVVTILGFQYLNRQRECKRIRIFTNIIILITIISIFTSFPRSTFFQLTAPAFETDDAKLIKNCKDHRLGIYLIERCLVRGEGVYFVTPGFNTNGFAYRGDPDLIISSSSVRQPLQYFPLIGDWELFEDNQ